MSKIKSQTEKFQSELINPDLDKVSLAAVDFLASVIEEDSDRFAQILDKFDNDEFASFGSSIEQIHAYLESKFKPVADRLAPITELTQMKQITSDDDEDARIEFENNPPNKDMEGILRAEVSSE